ncbi:hypothetical protein ACPVTF_11005 [Geobacillus icigianus]|uniref:Lipoprotein n=1 Tax=Geobacillus subterraneus TaxID=129338 RepID=A0A679FHV1_9BACL|nr:MULTISPECIES: hypothetical protein [Geobacillus]KYD28909.1 hypothetical protein B4113_3380 [Geobacillus sp. B4113_201601]BBW95892.1 hypothetical protein GsuE55_07250 [Geobacillus subterraneus]
MKLYKPMIGMLVAVLLSGCSDSPEKESKEPDKPKAEQTEQERNTKQDSQREEQSKKKGTRNEEQSSKQEDRSENQQSKIAEYEAIRSYVGQKVNWKPGVKESIQKFVRDHHQFYEDTLTYGRIKNVNWEQQKKHADALIKEAKAIIPEITEQIKTMEQNNLLDIVSIDDDPRDLKLDFEVLEVVLEIATSQKDTTGLVYAHRILHDLDVELNGTKTHKFGMSSYYHGGENRPELWKYIEKNGRERPLSWNEQKSKR